MKRYSDKSSKKEERVQGARASCADEDREWNDDICRPLRKIKEKKNKIKKKKKKKKKLDNERKEKEKKTKKWMLRREIQSEDFPDFCREIEIRGRVRDVILS